MNLNIWDKVNIASAIGVVGVTAIVGMHSLSPDTTPTSTNVSPSLPPFVQDDDSVTIYIDSLPPCATEDAAGPCMWDDGSGARFISLPLH